MLLSMLFGPEARASLENPSVSLSDPAAWRDTLGVSYGSDAAETVTHERAISLSAYWALVKMISGDVSKLPLEVFLRRGEDREPDYGHTAYDRINVWGMANSQVSALKFWRRFMVSALVYENAYGWLDWSNSGELLGIYNLLPDRTTVMPYRDQLWVVTEFMNRRSGRPQIEVIPYGDVLHVEGLCLNGLVGQDMVRQAREDIAQALAARKFTSKFFSNGAHIGGVLHVPPGTTKTAKDKVERGIRDKHSMDNAFRTMVLRDGFKWFATMAKPQEAQLAELDEAQARNAARRFMVAPSRIGIKESISYNSLEAEKRDYHDTALSYWLVATKSECNTKILSDDDRRKRRRFVDYNVNALLWSDASTVATILYQGVDRGVVDPNEIRRIWNWPALPAAGRRRYRRTARLRAAAAENLAAALRRARRRLAVRAIRAARNPRTFTDWLDRMDEERAGCQKIVQAAAAISRSLGQLTEDPVAALFAAVRSVLEQLVETVSRDQLPAAVEAALARLEPEEENSHVQDA